MDGIGDLQRIKETVPILHHFIGQEPVLVRNSAKGTASACPPLRSGGRKRLLPPRLGETKPRSRSSQQALQHGSYRARITIRAMWRGWNPAQGSAIEGRLIQ